ncbi:transglutaminase-like domain-containing protein [Amaricoccus macauensis]|uniref:transglutaminase-like domain-containing protein n=1 Tax=Amaricoccus macauensis TaxID=57001 RepID=UPI001620FDBB|nr:transglutaminase family protein [Amaricoccus macauensis]
MRIRCGYNITYACERPTPMVLALNIHQSRRADLLTPQILRFSPNVRARDFVDDFGNVLTRLVAPEGRLTVSTLFDVADSGRPDEVAPGALEDPIDALPDDVLGFLHGSRYCEADLLADFAWSEFAKVPAGWARVQAIVGFVHGHIAFDYKKADSRRTAFGAFTDRVGVCRDFAHLAVALCRAMNIPARYCTGYLGDIGVEPSGPMDFSAWFQVWLGGRWYTCDARHNRPRIGRVLIATGRDATDVAISTSFGAANLEGFEVCTDEIFPEVAPEARRVVSVA